jgi:WD40-like Beta Propeller Repeat
MIRNLEKGFFRAHSFLSILAALLLISLLTHDIRAREDDGPNYNAFGMKIYTISTPHFVFDYPQGMEDIARQAGVKFESLYTIYTRTYGLKLPEKTTVVITDDELTNGFADFTHNLINIMPHDLDWDLRGSHDWLSGVISHEFAHIMSITISAKLPPSLPYIQFGYISHYNEPNRLDLLHAFPNEILPPWFAEGIAQYEDSRHGTDSWDTHRDMILRTLTLSNCLLSIDHMNVFAGKEDNFEKTYDHGFALVKYISETYGYDKVVAILRASSVLYRLDLSSAIKSVLGISESRLYEDWKHSLVEKYNAQIKKIGKQVYGKKINKDGFDNFWPKFSPDEKKIFFLSNGKQDYSFSYKSLYSYSLIDTVKEDDRIKMEKGIARFYSINPPTGLIAFCSMKSKKSVAPPSRGGGRMFDVFIDTLPPEKPKFRLFRHKTEHQVTEKKSIFAAVFSPSGNKLACAMRIGPDRFACAITDTNGKNLTIVYPDSAMQSPCRYIYSLDWSPDGRHIALSYIDTGFRKIGFYDTLTHEFSVMKNAGYDDRDPRYGADGKCLYFSSDRTGIFNIYRYNFESLKLQKLTNVSGSAFAPDADKSQKKLVFVNYDKDGFGIYCIDSIAVLDETIKDSLFEPRHFPFVKPAGVPGEVHPYSHIPNKFLFIPWLIGEQTVPESYNVFKGHDTFKAGLLMNVADPFSEVGLGTDFDAYLLLEPQKIFDFINFDNQFFGKRINYDFGVSTVTKILPVTLTLDYAQRGIAATDSIVDFSSDKAKMVAIDYAATLRDIDAYFTHPLGGGLKANIIGSYNWYDIYMLTQDLYGADFPYTLAKGFTLGSFLTFLAPEPDSRSSISPRGICAKVNYGFQQQLLMNEDHGISIENGMPVENYDTYDYHEAQLELKTGISSPWYDKHDLYAELNFTGILPQQKLSNKLWGRQDSVRDVPTFYKPAVWVPGYTFYYEKRGLQKNTQQFMDTIKYDTVLVTGDAASLVNLAYRFPLWPTAGIDKKIWFFYLDKLYGAVNFSTGAGCDNVSDFFKFQKKDWLSSAGLEIRLEAVTFGYYPLDIKVRWDRGLNLPAPLGGDRFTLDIGFSFDNWELIDLPDFYFPRH